MAIIIAFERKRRELKKMDPKGNGGRVSKMCVWKSVTYHGVEEAARGSLEGEEPKLNQAALLVHLTLPFGCWRLNSCPAASSTPQLNPRLRLPALRSSGVLVLRQAHLCLLPSPRLAAMPFTTVRWHQGRTATGSYFSFLRQWKEQSTPSLSSWAPSIPWNGLTMLPGSLGGTSLTL